MNPNIKKLRDLYLTLTRPIAFAKGFSFALQIANEPSYYPECPRRSRARKICDNLGWLLRNGNVNRFYNYYGLDVIQDKARRNEFLDDDEFTRMQGDANRNREPESQTGVLRNKFLFYLFASACGLPVPEVFAVYEDERLTDTRMKEIAEEGFLADKLDYFLKDAEGMCASYVKHIHNFNEFKKERLNLTGRYIFQERVRQCEKMSSLYAGSLNTLRIVTVRNGGEPFVFAKILRVGTKETGVVDNWTVGGIAVGIHDDGQLYQYGLFRPNIKTEKAEVHPDTGVRFADFLIPMFDDAISLALRAHRFLNIHSIGWDIAITDEGPVLIEGNDNWDCPLMENVVPDFRSRWLAALPS